MPEDQVVPLSPQMVGLVAGGEPRRTAYSGRGRLASELTSRVGSTHRREARLELEDEPDGWRTTSAGPAAPDQPTN